MKIPNESTHEQISREKIIHELNNFEKFLNTHSRYVSDENMAIYEHFLDFKSNIIDLLSDKTKDKFNYEFNCFYGDIEPRFHGTLTDLSTLPVGSCFNVENGVWCGQIIEENNEKYLLVHNYYDKAYPSDSKHIINKIKLGFEYAAVINMVEDFPYIYNSNCQDHNMEIE